MEHLKTIQRRTKKKVGRKQRSLNYEQVNAPITVHPITFFNKFRVNTTVVGTSHDKRRPSRTGFARSMHPVLTVSSRNIATYGKPSMDRD